MRSKRSDSGGQISYNGSEEAADAEYERFRGCMAQLLDDKTMVGDVENRWVIFKDGWVYGMATYPTEEDATVFAWQIFRDERDTPYIIVRVNPEEHAISAMHLLASALDGLDLPPPEVDEDDPE